MHVRSRRRSKPSLLHRIRVLWVFIVVLLAAAGYGGYMLATWSAFDPKTIAVEGERHVSADEIRHRAAIPLDRNIWLLDKHAAERRIDAIPWIRSAAIHRSLPAEVRIVVQERVPAACVDSSSRRYLIDDTAHVLETACNAHELLRITWRPMEAQPAGAVLDASRVQRTLADAAQLRAANLTIARIGWDQFGGLVAELQAGPSLRFGDDRNLAQKAALVKPILHAYGGRANEVAAIDLRAASTPVVQLRRPKK